MPCLRQGIHNNCLMPCKRLYVTKANIQHNTTCQNHRARCMLFHVRARTGPQCRQARRGVWLGCTIYPQDRLGLQRNSHPATTLATGFKIPPSSKDIQSVRMRITQQTSNTLLRTCCCNDTSRQCELCVSSRSHRLAGVVAIAEIPRNSPQ